MNRSDPINKGVPRWITVLVSVLPAGGPSATFLALFILNVRPRLFNLSPKDSFLVAGIGLILLFTVLALLILCLALMGALRRALR